jgi:4-amino-4-deoxy-L-arabinose transferase-like glycosyltransferase
LFALTAVPWYAAMYYYHGFAFIDTFLGFHNITRFTSPEHPEGVLWYYFIPVLILGFLPWTAMMGQAVWAAVTDGRQHTRPLIFLLLWAAFIFLFFTASRTKLVSYILPMFPPLAMVVGWYIDRLWDARRGSRPWSWPLLLTVLLGLVAGGAVYAADRLMPALFPGAVAMAAVFVVMIIGVWYFVRRYDYDRAFWLKVTGMAVFSVILVTMLFPQAAPAFHSRDIAQAFAGEWDGKSPVYVAKFLRPGFAFYSGVYGRELLAGDMAKAIAQPGKTYFVIRKPDFENLSESERQKLRILVTADEKLLLLKQ